MSLAIQEVKKDNKKEWEQYINSRDDTTFVDCWAWRELVLQIYNLPSFWYLAKHNGQIEGILNLTFSRHPILGRYLVTAPFGTQGGFYADSESAFQRLLDKACELQHELKARYVLIRHLHGNLEPPNGWQQDPSFSTCYVPLNLDIDSFYKNHLRAKGRKPIKKSMKYGFRIKLGRFELLEDFWYVISVNMKNLGSPYHSKRYLRTLLSLFGPNSELFVLYSKDGKPAATGLCLYHCDTAILLHAHALEGYRPMRPAELLWWSIIKECYRKGLKWLDLGRSICGSGNERFKMKWRPVRYTLGYWYSFSPGIKLPKLIPTNPRFQIAIKVWQHLPLWVIRLAGPKLISGIL